MAETATGGYVVVELNDDRTSGLPCVDPRSFYVALCRALTEPRG